MPIELQFVAKIRHRTSRSGVARVAEPYRKNRQGLCRAKSASGVAIASDESSRSVLSSVRSSRLMSRIEIEPIRVVDGLCCDLRRVIEGEVVVALLSPRLVAAFLAEDLSILALTTFGNFE